METQMSQASLGMSSVSAIRPVLTGMY